MKSIYPLLIGTALFLPFESKAVETLDVMVVYSNTAQEHKNGKDMAARVAASIEYTNQAYQNSRANIRLRLVKLQKVNGYDGNLTSNDLSRLKSDSQVKQWREDSGADFVALYGASNQWCGIGYVPPGDSNTGRFYSNAPSLAYSITAINCGHVTFAHELGHNMGLGHSNAQNSSGGIWRWARGHGEYGIFVTIMGYQSAFGYPDRVPYFSNPDISECKGRPCGVPIGQPDEANAVEALNRVATQLADFRESKSTPGGKFQYLVNANQQCIGIDPGASGLIPVACESDDTLQWRLDDKGQLVNKAYPDYCADPGNNIENYSPLYITSCGQGSHQQWRQSGSSLVNVKNTKLLLTVDAQYRNLVVTYSNGDNGQKWMFTDTVPGGPGNNDIIYNFETSLDGWNAIYNGSTQRSNQRASEGRYSALNSSRDYWYSGMGLDITKLLKPNTSYKLTFDAFIEGSGNQTIDVRILSKDSSGWKWSNVYRQGVDSGAWKSHQATLKFNADANSLDQATLMIFGPNAGINFSIDQMIIKE